MSNKKQILLAFFIPLFLAISLLIAKMYILQNLQNASFQSIDKARTIGFCESCYLPLEFDIPSLLILALSALSFILPPFVMMRTYQGRRNKLDSPSIFE